MSLQGVMDEMSKGWRAQRSLSQMTIGKLIKEFEGLPQDKEIVWIDTPHSYRGYYSDLAFELEDGVQTVAQLLTTLKTQCLGHTFKGWKGGDFYMDEHTPLWIAEQGSCGVKIIGIKDGDVLLFNTQDDD